MKLKVKKLCVNYEGHNQRQRLTAVSDLSFEVDSGQFTVIVGPSGCGKSSILHCIAGLVTPTSGGVFLGDQQVLGPGNNRAMVFQSPSLMPWRTVIGNAMYGLEIQGTDAQTARTRASHYLSLLGLEKFEKCYPHELSGGMKQRVNLARALTIEANLLLFDEPLSALDAQTRSYLQVEIQQLVRRRACTTLYVTHDIREAIFLADQIIVLSSRPGSIKEIVPVSLPQCRTLDIQRDAEYVELEHYIWSSLQNEASPTQATEFC